MHGRANTVNIGCSSVYTRMKKSHGLLLGYIAASLALFLFSYTQVDLNLTLSRLGLAQTIQKAFQYIGFYQRSLAAGMYIGIITALFFLYGRVLALTRNGVLGIRDVSGIIGFAVIILVFSYPAAFSYDFFNYLFTAKTVLVYHQNPYTVTPLQFSGIDPWTNFMRWTHLTSAYTPLWIGLSLVPYIVGLGYFISVLFTTKIMVAGFYVLAVYALVKAVSKNGAKHPAYAMAMFALNPLILIESLVSGHNDIVLVSLAMLSVWMYMDKNIYSSWLYLGLSVAAKLMTIFLIPVYLLRKNKVWMLAAMVTGLIAVMLQREFLPWYGVWVLPFVALNYERTKIVRLSVIVSAGLLLSYTPYIYLGEYSVTESLWKMGFVWGSVVLGLISLVFPVKSKINV